jgi:phosphopantetheinyl transferase (holo-ACP synthase)
MIGTDIIDLKEARVHANWRRKGYLEKLFSKKEIQFIYDADHEEIAVWRLWSMKESAYKANFYRTRERKFNPIKFECEVQHDQAGLIRYDSETFLTSSVITKEYVLTWTSNYKDHTFCKPVKTGIHEVGVISKLLYLKLQHELAEKFSRNPADIMIHKNKGVPEVSIRGEKTVVYCSVSHHGAYGSFVYCC